MKTILFLVASFICFNIHPCVPSEIKNKTLSSERCIIRPAGILDFKNYYSLLTIPEVAKYQFGPKLSADEIEHIKTIPNKLKLLISVSNIFPSVGYRWIIEKKDSGEFIGFIGLSPVKKSDYNFEHDKNYINVAGARSPQFKNQGYWQEAFKTLMLHNAPSDDTVLLMAVNPENQQACNLAKKLQCTEIGTYQFDGNILIQKPYTITLFAIQKK